MSSMPQTVLFGEVVEAADSLSVAEQEALVDILRHRLAAARRNELVGYVREAQREFQAGQAEIATVDDIMNDLIPQYPHTPGETQ